MAQSWRAPGAAAQLLRVLTLVAALAPAVAAAEAPPAPAAPAPYSLPWQLRPAAALSVVRSDTSLAFSEGMGGDATTATSMMLLSYKATLHLAPMVRLGIVRHAPPGAMPGSGTAFVNPALGAFYGGTFGPDVRFSAFLGVALPLGMGGGNTPDPGVAAAARAGVLARSSLDNAMFAVNYATAFPGLDVAWVRDGFTAQLEVTILQLVRTRGEQVEKDSARTNSAVGLHLGYFLVPQLSIGAELRYQRWLSTPAAVAADDALRDNLTLAVGPRAHFKLGDRLWFRPGVSYTRGLDDPMSRQSYHIVQLDLPFPF